MGTLNMICNNEILWEEGHDLFFFCFVLFFFDLTCCYKSKHRDNARHSTFPKQLHLI